MDPYPRGGCFQPGAPADAARTGLANNQRSTALRAAARPGRDLHGCLLGSAGHRTVVTTAAQALEPVRNQRAANGRRHGDDARVASRPIRWQGVRRRLSFGATFAAYAAVRRPELVAALVAAGMDIDMPAAEKSAYAFALEAARRNNNRRAIQQLEAIGPPPHTTARQFNVRARWVANFGGVATNANYHGMLRALLITLVRSPDYSAADVIRTFGGMRASQTALLPQLATTDLVRAIPRLEVPIVLAQGRFDQVAPAEAARRFHDSLTAPSKQLAWFEKSAHTPHLEEPAKFRALLMNVVASTHAARPAEGHDRLSDLLHSMPAWRHASAVGQSRRTRCCSSWTATRRWRRANACGVTASGRCVGR